jgi:hypothetical protein
MADHQGYQRVAEIAARAGAKWPELVAAQWALESGWGRSTSGRNNYFGLKGPGTIKETIEYFNGKPVTIVDSFLDFDSLEECVQYLVDRWYKDWKGHTGINNAATAEDGARMLVSEGYATDPKYANKLVNIMTSAVSVQSELASLVDAAEHYEGLSHQERALRELEATLTIEQRRRFTDTWRSGPVAPAAPKFPLQVPYFYQADSKTWQGQRMCQSSAIAMRIEQIDPKIIGDDDSYLAVVNRYGDTVSQSVHQRALASLGLKAEFRQNGTEQVLCDLLDQGIAVPIGVLHKGPVTSPTGGGHWVTLIGYNQTHFWVHDPFGEMDLANGGYVKTGPKDGQAIQYTRKNLMRRWLIHSKADGWLWVIRK